MKLDHHDLRFSVLRLPKWLVKVVTDPEWKGKIFIGGGYIRSVVSGEKVNDIDIFCPNKQLAELLAMKLAKKKEDVHTTANAYTIPSTPTIQIIHRWLFEKPEDVANSFDFTVCCAVIFYDENKWDSFCDDRFYPDLAAKRLVYRSPVRNEDAGGSLLRVLKYYQKGYRIPLDSLGAVIARLMKDFNVNQTPLTDEAGTAKVITGLLREVDPLLDPTHAAHLPASKGEDIEEGGNQ